MAVARNLMTRFGADFSVLFRQVAKAQVTMSGFQKSMVRTTGRINTALAAVGAGLALKDIVSDAVKTEAAIATIGHTLGDSAQEFVDWASTSAAAFGLSKSEALSYGRAYIGLVSVFSKSTDEMKNSTIDLLKASAIVSAKSGRTMEDVLERIRSGMLGNTEAIEDLNVNVYTAAIEQTEAFKKLGQGAKNWDSLQNYSLKQQIRYYAILEQISKQYGDTIGDSTAVKINIFTAQLKNLKTTLGEAFLPILNFILPTLQKLAYTLVQAANFVSQFTHALFGAKGTVKTSTSGFNKMTASIEDATEAQKGFLAGFDEINSADTSPSVSGDTSPIYKDSMGASDLSGESKDLEIRFLTITQKAQDMATGVKSAFSEMKKFLDDVKLAWDSNDKSAGVFDSTLNQLRNTFTNTKNDFSTLSEPLKKFFREDLSTLALNAGYSISNAFAGVLDSGAKIFDGVRDSAMPVLQEAVNNTLPMLADVGNKLLDVFNTTFNTAKQIFDRLFSEGVKPALDLVGQATADTLNTLKQSWDKYGTDITDGLKLMVTNIGDIFNQIWDTVVKPIWDYFLKNLKELWDTKLKDMVGSLVDFVGKLIWGSLEIINKFVYPLVKIIIGYLAPIFVEGFKNMIDTLFLFLGFAVDIISKVIKVLSSIIDFIVGVFTGDWDKAWNALGDIVSGVFDILWTTIKFTVNLIVDAINGLIRGFNKISFNVPEWVPFLGGKNVSFDIPEIPRLARGGIVDSPTIAQIGEAGKEMVVPLENTSFVDKLASALGTAVSTSMGSQGGQAGDIVINVGGSSLARIAASELNRLNRQAGRTILQV